MIRRIGAATTATGILGGLLIAALPTVAQADQAVKRFEHSTDVYCETVVDDLFVSAGVNRNVSDEGVQTYAFAAVYDEAGTVDASGEVTGIRFADGVVEATVELVDHDDQPYGVAHLAGSYEIGDAQIWRGRPLKLFGNQFLVMTSTFSPVDVTWQTLDVAGVELVRDGAVLAAPGCDGYDLVRDDIQTEPHRSSVEFQGYELTAPCSAGPIEDIQVMGSEGGLSLFLQGPDGALGETNLDVSATTPQHLGWYLPADDSYVDATITALVTRAGSPVTTTEVQRGSTVRTTVRPMMLAFTAGLPDGSSVSGTCGIAEVTTRFAVEALG